MISEQYQFSDFDPSSSRGSIPPRLIVRAAEAKDIESISQLVYSRGQITLDDARKKTEGEFPVPSHKVLLVAELNDEVIGFARSIRFGKEKERGVPLGWYLMGVIVDARYRRLGIGELLTHSRIERIFATNESVYYFADPKNLPSIKLHERLGFREIERRASYLGIETDSGECILFEKRK